MIRYFTSGFFTLLAALMLLRFPAAVDNPSVDLMGNPDALPFSFVVDTPSDPFVLPSQTNNHLLQVEFERNKLPVTELKCPLGASDSFQSTQRRLSPHVEKVFRVEPLYLVTRILRL